MNSRTFIPWERDSEARLICSRIHFTDGHNTGLYTWSYLRELGDEKATRMAAYEKQLAEHGLKRD